MWLLPGLDEYDVLFEFVSYRTTRTHYCVALFAEFVSLTVSVAILLSTTAQGARCIVKDCCMLLPDCELPPDTTAAPFTIWAGSPAKCIGELPAGYREDRYSQAKTLYASWEAPMRAV